MIKIKIQNFRSIKKISFEEAGTNVISLVGANNSGKSNILDAILKLNTISSFSKDDFISQKTDSGSDVKNEEIYIKAKLEFMHKRLLEEIKKFLNKWDTETLKKTDFFKLAEPIIIFLKKIETLKIKYSIWVICKSLKEEPKHFLSTKKGENFEFDSKRKTLWKNICNFLKSTKINNEWRIYSEDDECILKAYRYENNFFKNIVQGHIKNNRKKSFIFQIIDLYRKFALVDIQKPLIKKIQLDRDLLSKESFDLSLLDDINLPIKYEKESVKLKKWFKLLSINEKEIKDILSNVNTTDKGNKLRKIIENASDKANERLNKIHSYIGDERRFNFRTAFFPGNRFEIWMDDKDLKNGMIYLDKTDKCSDGIKTFLLLCLEIMSVSKNQPSILLIDEPELHLNPFYQEKIVDLFSKRAHSNTFIIFATHSIFMLEPSSKYISKKIVFRSKKDNATNLLDYYKTLDKDVINKVDLESAEMLLSNYDTDFNEWIISKKFEQLVFVEGQSDKIILNRCLEEWKIDNTFIVVLNGFAFRQTIDKALQKFKYYLENKTFKFKMLLDNDQGGKKIQNEIENIQKKNNVVIDICSYKDFLNNNTQFNVLLENFLEYDKKIHPKNAKKIELNFKKKQFKELKKWLEK